MSKLTFTGHDTFYCRTTWIKKGLDHAWNEQPFNDAAVVDLGVGRNMVSAIRFWLKAFGLVDTNEKPNQLAEYLFGEDGKDTYCEDLATLWLLHYSLVTTSYSSIYDIVFNRFRKQQIEFTKQHLEFYLERLCAENGINFNSNSIKRDVNVFLNNYIPSTKAKSVEDRFVGLLHDLKLVSPIQKINSEKKEWYKIENDFKTDLPYEIFLFCLLDTYKDANTISIAQIRELASIFVINSNGLRTKIDSITENFSDAIVFTEDAGISVLQIKKPLDRWQILNNYYAT